MIIERYEQRTPEWYAGRLGCITMSHCKDLLTGGGGATRRAYLLDVASERLTNVAANDYTSWAMQRGIDLEPYAFAAYKATTGLDMQSIGLAYLDAERRVSCSPDGILMDGDRCIGGVEIKCLAPKNHLKIIESGSVPREHLPQVQGAIWLTSAPWWDWVSFCPEIPAEPIVIHRVEPDQDTIARIFEEVYKGLDFIDLVVETTGYRPVNQEVLDICAEARLAIAPQDNDGEVDLYE